MAVDSNVLIFERIREELQTGKTIPSAVDQGFQRAIVTIIDTHVTTIISSLFLFVFGTGPLRGFAVTLVLGLLINLFSAVYVSRTIFMWELSRKRTRGDAEYLITTDESQLLVTNTTSRSGSIMIQVFKNVNIDWLGRSPPVHRDFSCC